MKMKTLEERIQDTKDNLEELKQKLKADTTVLAVKKAEEFLKNPESNKYELEMLYEDKLKKYIYNEEADIYYFNFKKIIYQVASLIHNERSDYAIKAGLYDKALEIYENEGMYVDALNCANILKNVDENIILRLQDKIEETRDKMYTAEERFQYEEAEHLAQILKDKKYVIKYRKLEYCDCNYYEGIEKEEDFNDDERWIERNEYWMK